MKLERRIDRDVVARPSELQETAARDLGRILKTEIDPFTVRDLGLSKSARYYNVEVEAFGITFFASYTWGGRDWRYHYAGSWSATVGRWLSRRTIAVQRLADLDGWL